MPNEKDNQLDIGRILLTQVGLELASVCQAPGVEGFFDYVTKKWDKHLQKDKNTEHLNSADAKGSAAD
jgi:hypothetical protein